MRRAVLIFTLLSSLVGNAQTRTDWSRYTTLGSEYFEHEQYALALDFFLRADLIDSTRASLHYKIAECYRHTFDYERAERYYQRVYLTDAESFPLGLYYYALMMKLNGNFEGSIMYFSEFIDIYGDLPHMMSYVEQAYIEKAGCQLAKLALDSKRNNEALTENGLNTPYHDFAPAPIDSNRIIVTSGKISSNRDLIDHRSGEAFTENFLFEKNNDQWVDKTKQQKLHVLNTRYHDGSGSFNSSRDKYYFTVCSGKTNCMIYVSRLTEGKWEQPVPLNRNINLPNSENKHPSLSPGSDTLFFTSDRNGGAGEYDIWMSVDAGSDQWGPAMNLGQGVNTSLNEIAPCATILPNVLFFASDGHPGFGGLDLFMAKRMSTSDTLLYNLDIPYNSSRDDAFMALDKKRIYWSSNRNGGVGGFDIYSAAIKSPLSFISLISLKKNARRDIHLKSHTQQIEVLNIVASRQEERMDYHTLTYEKKKIVNKIMQNQANGSETVNDFENISNDEFNQLCTVADLKFMEMLARRKDKTLIGRVLIASDSTQRYAINGTLKDSLSGGVLSDRKVLLLDDNLQEIIKVTQTNTSGTFRFTDIPSGSNLSMKLELADDHQLPFVDSLTITGSGQMSEMYSENIYFDLNHHYIRPEASVVLKELAAFLIAHPAVQVEIFAYADDLGAADYNLSLTQKRGQSVVDYLEKLGVDETSLAIIPKGKQDVRPTRLERQYNRRVEFYLNGLEEKLSASTKTFILKKHVDWHYIAEETGVNLEVLKSLNGATSSYVKPFQPVRIPLSATSISSAMFFTGG